MTSSRKTGMSTKAFCGLVLALTVSGCDVYAGLTMPPALKEAVWSRSIPFRSILFEGELFQSAGARSTVFKSEEEVATFLADRPVAFLDGKGGRYSLPAIDFAREVGVLVEAGGQEWGGRIEVVAIEERADSMYVRSVIWVPEPGGMKSATQALPIHYVAMPRTDKAIVFAPFIEAERRQAPSRIWPDTTPLPLSSAVSD
jgi:hypothetical protein